MHGVSTKFEQLLAAYVAENRLHPKNYCDMYNRVSEYRSAFHTEQSCRIFVGILDCHGSYAQARYSLIQFAVNSMPIDAEFLQVVKLIDCLTNGWMQYLKIHGHTPVDAQMFCAAVLTYDLTQVINNGDVY